MKSKSFKYKYRRKKREEIYKKKDGMLVVTLINIIYKFGVCVFTVVIFSIDQFKSWFNV